MSGIVEQEPPESCSIVGWPLPLEREGLFQTGRRVRSGLCGPEISKSSEAIAAPDLLSDFGYSQA